MREYVQFIHQMSIYFYAGGFVPAISGYMKSNCEYVPPMAPNSMHEMTIGRKWRSRCNKCYCRYGR